MSRADRVNSPNLELSGEKPDLLFTPRVAPADNSAVLAG